MGFLRVAAVLLWVIVLFCELHQALFAVMLVRALPSHETQVIRSGSRLALACAAPPRRRWAAILASLRMSLAGALLVTGARWLASTGSSGELMLSTAVLAFALDVPRHAGA